jgi:hypothetical protein
MTNRAAEIQLADPAAKARMEQTRNQIANVRSNIFLTLVELDRFQGNPNAEQFQVYTNQLAVMANLCRAFAKHAEEMKQKGQVYFADWEAKTPALQDPEAQKRYTERKRSYEAINRYMQDARENFLQFFEDLTSIQPLLLGERDEKSRTRARDLFMHANWRCIDTQRALMSMEDEFDRLADSFAKDAYNPGR